MEMQRYVDEQRRHPTKTKRSQSRSTPVNDDVEHATEPPAESPASESQPAQQSEQTEQEQEQEIPMETTEATSSKKKSTKKPAAAKAPKAARKPTAKKAATTTKKAAKAEKPKLSGAITDVKPQQETYLRLIFGDSGAITLRVMSSATDSGRQENRDLVIKAIRDLVK